MNDQEINVLLYMERGSPEWNREYRRQLIDFHNIAAPIIRKMCEIKSMFISIRFVVDMDGHLISDETHLPLWAKNLYEAHEQHLNLLRARYHPDALLQAHAAPAASEKDAK